MQIISWVKKMIYLSIFLVLLLQLIPNESYRKYVKLVAGLLFILTIVSPVFGWFHIQTLDAGAIAEQIWQQETTEPKLDFSEMEEKQQEYYKNRAADYMEEDEAWK